MGNEISTSIFGMEEKHKTTKVVINLPHHDEDRWIKIGEVLGSKVDSGDDLDHLLSNFGKRSKTFRSFKEEEIKDVFPFIASLALKLPELFPNPVFHLLTNQDDTIIFTREQVACLLASSFLGLFSAESYPKGYRWPIFDIAELFGSWSTVEFVKCILNYFVRIKQKMPTGNLRIHRKVLTERPKYSNSTKKITPITVTDELIENFIDKPFHADFANQFIGGGVLEGGCVQEEILFVIKPECLVSMLVCCKMEDNEAIIITGAEQFSAYSGYANSFRWEADHQDKTPRDEEFDCIKNHIVGVDAIVARGRMDFMKDIIERDINKCFIGICNPEKEESRAAYSENSRVYVTGNWGCGAFGGDPHLKAIEQIIAASEAEMELIYSTFKREQFGQELREFVHFIQTNQITTGQLYRALMICAKKNLYVKVFSKIKEILKPEENEQMMEVDPHERKMPDVSTEKKYHESISEGKTHEMSQEKISQKSSPENTPHQSQNSAVSSGHNLPQETISERNTQELFQEKNSQETNSERNTQESLQEKNSQEAISERNTQESFQEKNSQETNSESNVEAKKEIYCPNDF